MNGITFIPKSSKFAAIRSLFYQFASIQINCSLSILFIDDRASFQNLENPGLLSWPHGHAKWTVILNFESADCFLFY